jgi:SAM-dependent methyltransferase
VIDPNWNDKDSKIPRFRELYEQAPYLKAYARHTGLRVEDDPRGACGGRWADGELQLAFLVERGMTPYHWLMDLGCGTGKLARHAVPFLDANRYTGIDISMSAVGAAIELGADEGWYPAKQPEFVVSDGGLSSVWMTGRRFDYVWAHSVLTHLPEDAIGALFDDLRRVSFGRFFFTYKLGARPARVGLKNFVYPFEFLEGMAADRGLTCERDPKAWAADHLTAVIRVRS